MSDLIGEYTQHLTGTCAGSTAGTYLEILHRADRDLPYGLATACSEELQGWLNAPTPYGRDRKAATRHTMRAALVSFFTFACDPLLREHPLDFNPALLLPAVPVDNEKPDPIPTAQLRDILLCAADPYRGWFLIASHEGLRCMELAALDKEHIRQDRTWVQGKGGRNRRVPTHPLVWEYALRRPSGPVCADGAGVRLSPRQVSRCGNYYLQRVLGHADVHMHRLRDTYATNAYLAEKDIMAVKQLLGHRQVTTTQRYIAVSSEQMAAAVAGLPDVA